jgi:hypothetical protein
VILVGAGASYGALDLPEARPPLGNRLFPVLVEAFPQTWGRLPPDVVEMFDNPDAGFERGMELLWQRSEAQNALLDMSVYFTRYRLLPGTNRYLSLLMFLRSYGSAVEQLSIGSLNYETLLEHSLTRANVPCFYAGWADAGPGYVRVIKPHGSCNFVPDFGGAVIQGISFSNVGVALAGANVKVVHLDEVEQEVRTTGFPSVMSLYAPGKKDVVCPEFGGRLRAEWVSAVGAAEAIVVIGARPMLESDHHIWDSILASQARIALIGGEFDCLQEKVGDRLTPLGEKFEDGLDPLKDWLSDLLSTRDGRRPP